MSTGRHGPQCSVGMSGSDLARAWKASEATSHLLLICAIRVPVNLSWTTRLFKFQARQGRERNFAMSQSRDADTGRTDLCAEVVKVKMRALFFFCTTDLFWHNAASAIQNLRESK